MIRFVLGLPRSGTASMMGALQAGGLEVNISNPNWRNGGNPKGYFEPGNTPWWKSARVTKVFLPMLAEEPKNIEADAIIITRPEADRAASGPQWSRFQFTTLLQRVQAKMIKVNWTTVAFYDLLDNPGQVVDTLIAADWPITNKRGFVNWIEPGLVKHRT